MRADRGFAQAVEGESDLSRETDHRGAAGVNPEIDPGSTAGKPASGDPIAVRVSATYEGSMKLPSRIAVAVLLIGIAFVTLSPIQYRPETGHPDFERAGAYLLLGIVLGLGFPGRVRYSIPFVTVLAAALEALQLLVPGRDARFHDMLIKAAAGIAGIALAKLAVASLSRAGLMRGGSRSDR